MVSRLPEDPRTESKEIDKQNQNQKSELTTLGYRVFKCSRYVTSAITGLGIGLGTVAQFYKADPQIIIGLYKLGMGSAVGVAYCLYMEKMYE